MNLSTISHRNSVDTKKIHLLAFASIFLTLGLIVLYSPLTVFSSSAGEFNLTIGELTGKLFLLFLVSSVSLSLGYLLLPRWSKSFVARSLSFVAVIGWVYTYLVPGDFGYLDGLILSDFSVPSRIIRFCELLGVMFLFIIYLPLSGKFMKQLMLLVLVLNLMSFGQTLFNVSSADFSSRAESEESAVSESSLFSFSRDSNVVVIMLDMFCGGVMPDLIGNNSELVTSFDGFSWYKNTLTNSVNTFGSMPALLGGHRYCADIMNQRDKPLWEQLTDAYSFWGSAPELRDYSVAMTGLAYLKDPAALHNIEYVSRAEVYDYWCNTTDGAATSRLSRSCKSPVANSSLPYTFAAIGLFKFSPFCFKRKIYDNASWLHTNSSGIVFRHTLSNLATLKVLPLISDTDSPQKSIKIIASELTHFPWTIDDSGNVTKQFVEETEVEIPFDGFKKRCYNPVLPYNTSRKALLLLAEWFNWLKENGIYDNTKIIIVSDHGYSGPNPMIPEWTDIFTKDGVYLDGTARVHPLLLVKDFNERGDLKTSDIFMSNADVPALIASAVGGIEGIAADPIKNPVADRELKVHFTPWLPQENRKNSFKIYAQYGVKNNIFNRKNWKILQ